MRIALLITALQGVSVGGSVDTSTNTLRLRPDSGAMATAYADEQTRELVRRARGRRGVIDASVFHYQATARQRLSVGIRSFRRDRILYRREGASTIEWWRDRPGRVVVHAAREAVPLALRGVRVPDDLDDWARDFLPEPGDDRLWVSPMGDGFAWHPLVEGGEALYRYAIGDTTVLRLPERGQLRLVELRVTPRKPDFRVVTGSFWIELDNHSVVQAVFRPAREFDLDRDLAEIDPDSDDDADDIPGILKPVRVDVRYVTVEYGLWEMRWWMPRLMAFEGFLQMGALRVPATMELSYSDYTVEADRFGLPELPPLIRHLAGDPNSEPRPYAPRIRVVVPDDTASLLHSHHLPESLFAEGPAVISEAELSELGERIGALPPPPWEVGRPDVTPPWALGQGLLRYNRVEGLSAGARVDWDMSRLRLDLTGRLGAADLTPRGELGVEIPTARRSWRVAGYHRLADVDPALRPFSLGSSISAMVLGRDEGMYYQASGAEVRLTPATPGRNYRVRLYGERQRSVDRATDFSLAHLAGGEGFRPNIRAADADQVGLAVRLGVARGLDPTGARWGAVLDVSGETGSFTFLRPGLTLRASAPVIGKVLGGVEVGAGTTLSPETGAAAVPVQSHWFLGGTGTLRGFDGGAFSGRDYLRGRVELANDFPAARVVVFSDVGWAGRFDQRTDREPGLSAGVGASFLDGLVRVDLARAIRPVERWRLDLYLDALF